MLTFTAWDDGGNNNTKINFEMYTDFCCGGSEREGIIICLALCIFEFIVMVRSPS